MVANSMRFLKRAGWSHRVRLRRGFGGAPLAEDEENYLLSA